MQAQVEIVVSWGLEPGRTPGVHREIRAVKAVSRKAILNKALRVAKVLPCWLQNEATEFDMTAEVTILD